MVVHNVHVNCESFEHKFWTDNFLVYFIRFTNTSFRKFDRHKHVSGPEVLFKTCVEMKFVNDDDDDDDDVQRAEIAWNTLLLCLRFYTVQ